MGKSEIECDKFLRHNETIISQRLTVSITLNLCSAHYHIGKESDNVLLVSDCTSFFNDTGGLSPQLNEQKLFIICIANARAKKQL